MQMQHKTIVSFLASPVLDYPAKPHKVGDKIEAQLPDPEDKWRFL